MNLIFKYGHYCRETGCSIPAFTKAKVGDTVNGVKVTKEKVKALIEDGVVIEEKKLAKPKQEEKNGKKDEEQKSK